MSDTRRIDDIVVGPRHRRDLGDIDGLAASIGGEVGLLHPIVVQPDGTLIAGERRLKAAKLLGWTDIPVNVIRLADIARGEFAENAIRKDFTLSEAVAIKRALEPIERAAAQARMRAGKPSGKFPKGRALDMVAHVAGKDRRTIERAEAVVEAAEAEPGKFGKLAADMDRTGRVHGPYKRLVVARRAEAIRAEPPPLPGKGPYRVAVIDPPWPYELRDDDPSHRAVRPYPTMPIAEMCKLAVGEIMHADAVLWLWIPNFELVHGAHLEVLRAWGFEPKTLITWGKDRMAHGDWLRAKTEHCIMCVRGKPTIVLTNQTTLMLAPMRAHSQKPVEFYDLVESLCPAPRYADLFSRYRHNERWDCHGDEAPPDRSPAGGKSPGTEMNSPLPGTFTDIATDGATALAGIIVGASREMLEFAIASPDYDSRWKAAARARLAGADVQAVRRIIRDTNEETTP